MPTLTSDPPLAFRIVILGTGTAIGKTYVSRVLAKGLNLKLPNVPVLALKPLESGIAKSTAPQKTNPEATLASDAALLAAASSPSFEPPPPLYWLPEPLSPHLSARRSGQLINLSQIVDWVTAIENSAPQCNTSNVTFDVAMISSVTSCVVSRDAVAAVQPPYSRRPAARRTNSIHKRIPVPYYVEPSVDADSSRALSDVTSSSPNNVCSISIIETAGAVFSPLNTKQTNFDLALSLEPCQWVLVAPDRLGVLHELTATLATMKLRGRIPDFIVLSQPNPDDASLGTNAKELEQLGIASVDAVIPHCGASPNEFLTRIVRAISARQT